MSKCTFGYVLSSFVSDFEQWQWLWGSMHYTRQIEIQSLLIYYLQQSFSCCEMSKSPMKNGHCNGFENMCLAFQTAVNKQVKTAVCAAVCVWSSCSLKPTKYFSVQCPGVVFLSVSPPFYLLCFCLFFPALVFTSCLAVVLFRCFVEPVIMRRSEDAHHPGCPGCADQCCDHPPLGLGHLPAYTGGPQAAPTLLPGPPQCHRLPSVSVAVSPLFLRSSYPTLVRQRYFFLSRFFFVIALPKLFLHF